MLGAIVIAALLTGIGLMLLGAWRWGTKLIAAAIFLGLVLPFVTAFGAPLLAWLKQYAYLLWIGGGVLLGGGYLRFRERQARWQRYLSGSPAALKHRVERY